MTPTRRKLLFAAAGVAAGLLLAELALQLFSLVVPARMDILRRAQAPISIPDGRLGHRPNPDFPDHDENGFRNASVPRTAEIIAMGDSQTYGTHVLREEAWPSRLGSLAGRKVYSISCGGWCPTQSLILLDRALAFRPRVIVEAFYFGNDLYDAFETLYYMGQLPELRTTDASAAAAIRDAEARERLVDRYSKLYDRVFSIEVPAAAEGSSEGSTSGVRAFLRAHCKLYQLAHVVKTVAAGRARESTWEEDKRDAETSNGRDLLRVLETGSVRTIFTPVFRSEAMNLEDPRLAEGFRVCLAALERMNARVRASGASFLVLLVPIKEQVYRPAVPASLESDPEYRLAVDDEGILRERIVAFLKERGIDAADPLPALQESLARGVPPYPESMDGHPNPQGHRVIATFLLEELKRRGLLR